MGKSKKNLEDVGEDLPQEVAGNSNSNPNLGSSTSNLSNSTSNLSNSTSSLSSSSNNVGNGEEEEGTLISSIIKNIKVGGDMTAISFSGSLVLPKSGLCYFSENTAPYLHLLAQCNDIEDDCERMLQVFRFVMATRWLPTELKKKPMNPVLGETYEAHINFPDSDMKVTAFAEQISHHPPIASTEIYCRKAGIKVNYFCPVKVSFMGTYIKLGIDGSVHINLSKFGETYSMTSPPIAVRIFRGFSEFAGELVLSSSKSSYKIKATFYPKPLLVGNYNALEATVYNGDEKLYKIKGLWDEQLNIAPYKEKKSGASKPFFVKKDYTPGDIVLPSQDKKHPTNSEFIWGALFDAIKTKQPSRAINKEKIKVEEEQRRKAAERKERNEQWQPKHFIKDRDGFWGLNPELHNHN